MRIQKDNLTKQTWIPQKERIWVAGAITVTTLIVVWQLWSLLQLPSATLHSRSFEHTFKNYGSNARIALFFVLANYVLAFIIKQRIWERLDDLKKWMVTLLRFARSWHTPIAILAIALILLHVVAVFMYGFKFDFNNISGILALLVLLPVPVSGLLRYRRLDRKWHLRFGLAFAVLFLIHSFF
ncbi:hypothetical protein [Paenibacillus radicis (ex Xue et al. 2023)]|uniref:Ferric oxidoreductase domain-containing protein n=1 Tax=Paenibacillus radicis (ex Xue et al. 2023) TaxID=2972489 RepID=A0ABT1Y9Z6_9BACL|nr:hypothetical protein [Paenibacillus radicis (ex Xue et al. 2023)]MCR8629992.1 hypothetical protein [Paenibacillus radicis (ex Xue et al. 2023)]